jgi:hypothetical protein
LTRSIPPSPLGLGHMAERQAAISFARAADSDWSHLRRYLE